MDFAPKTVLIFIKCFNMKSGLIWLLTLGFVLHAPAQKMISEGVVTYGIEVVNAGNNKAVADAFAGARQLLHLKGFKARLDFISPLRQQFTIFDGQSGDAFILKEAGAEKYLLDLPAAKWKAYNKRFEGIVFSNTNEQKTIAGYPCVKAIGTLKDGGTIAVYYTLGTDILAKGYDYAFRSLPGLPLEYEIASGEVLVRYTASQVQLTMVGLATFEKPETGYKVLQFKQ